MRFRDFWQHFTTGSSAKLVQRVKSCQPDHLRTTATENRL